MREAYVDKSFDKLCKIFPGTRENGSPMRDDFGRFALKVLSPTRRSGYFCATRISQRGKVTCPLELLKQAAREGAPIVLWVRDSPRLVNAAEILKSDYSTSHLNGMITCEFLLGITKEMTPPKKTDAEQLELWR